MGTETPARRAPLYIWFDTEFTTLDLEQARVLQVAVLATDAGLRPVGGEGGRLRACVRLPDDHPVSPWVAKHLAELLSACRAESARPAPELDDELVRWIERLAGPPEGPPEDYPVLAGNSLHNDWWLARRWFPRFTARVSYRHLDVTTLKLLWLAGGGEEFDKDRPGLIRAHFPGADLSGGPHDAWYDVQASVAELAFYRSRMPGV